MTAGLLFQLLHPHTNVPELKFSNSLRAMTFLTSSIQFGHDDHSWTINKDADLSVSKNDACIG